MDSISGDHIKRLMRNHKITIVELANRMGITQKRVRQVRHNGVNGECMCLDWYEGIFGKRIFLL